MTAQEARELTKTSIQETYIREYEVVIKRIKDACDRGEHSISIPRHVNERTKSMLISGEYTVGIINDDYNENLTFISWNERPENVSTDSEPKES